MCTPVRKIEGFCSSAMKTTLNRNVCHVCMMVDRCECFGGIWWFHVSSVPKMEAHSSRLWVPVCKGVQCLGSLIDSMSST